MAAVKSNGRFLQCLANNRRYELLGKSMHSWEFAKQYIRDKKAGEWVWDVKEDNSIVHEADKRDS